MSHDLGAVRFSDGLVLWYDYNGTVDIPVSHLVERPEFDKYLADTAKAAGGSVQKP